MMSRTKINSLKELQARKRELKREIVAYETSLQNSYYLATHPLYWLAQSLAKKKGFSAESVYSIASNTKIIIQVARVALGVYKSIKKRRV